MSQAAIAKPKPRQRKPALTGRVIFASAIGTTVEWYDFLLYGSAAGLVFGKVFFPKSDPVTGAMLSFATFGVGFLARPIGGIIFGHFGDRVGRKTILTISMLIMGFATFAIGLLPTYAQAGLLAPSLLVLLRLAQGFGLGGQWGGAILMSAEYGSAERRGLWTGFTQAGGGFGNFLATLVLAGAAMGALTMPLWGLLSDRIGRRPVYGFGAAGLIAWGFVFFPLLETKSPALITLAMAVGVTVHSAMNGPQGAFIAELFPTRIRYSGASLCYQVTSIVGGSWAPLISLALFRQFQSTVPISLYLAFSCAVSLVGVLFAKETKGKTFAEIDKA
jgi:MFS family permease